MIASQILSASLLAGESSVVEIGGSKEGIVIKGESHRAADEGSSNLWIKLSILLEEDVRIGVNGGNEGKDVRWFYIGI